MDQMLGAAVLNADQYRNASALGQAGRLSIGTALGMIYLVMRQGHEPGEPLAAYRNRTEAMRAVDLLAKAGRAGHRILELPVW